MLYQSGTGSKAKIGINTTKPASTLDVKGGGTIRGLFSLPATGTATSSAGFNSQPQELSASSYNSGAGAAVNQNILWQAEPTGNNTNNASGSLNLLFALGNNKPSETGLNIANNGQITFANGQTFPGTGTITGITTTSGSGLSGGGASGNLSLSLVNSCATNQVLQWNGSAWACFSAGSGTITGVTAGTDLTGGGTSGNVTLNLDTTKVPQLAASNTFTGNQTVNGNLSASGTFSAGPISATTTSGTVPAVTATDNSTTYTNSAVVGTSVTGTGVSGTGPNGYGVAGSGYTGVYATGTSWGLYAISTTGNGGVFGGGANTGVYGDGGSGSGVYGTGLTGVYGNGGAYGVYAEGPTGVYGDGTTYGVYGYGPIGVFGQGTTGVNASGTSYGVYSVAPTAVYAVANAQNNPGVYAHAGAPGVGPSMHTTTQAGPGSSLAVSLATPASSTEMWMSTATSQN